MCSSCRRGVRKIGFCFTCVFVEGYDSPLIAVALGGSATKNTSSLRETPGIRAGALCGHASSPGGAHMSTWGNFSPSSSSSSSPGGRLTASESRPGGINDDEVLIVSARAMTLVRPADEPA